jgi:hypothetical protein
MRRDVRFRRQSPIPLEERDMKTWWYADRNKRKGPVEIAELRRLLEAGKIGLKTFVWQEGMPAWLPLDEVDALHVVKAAMPPPLPFEPEVAPALFPTPTTPCNSLPVAEGMSVAEPHEKKGRKSFEGRFDQAVRFMEAGDNERAQEILEALTEKRPLEAGVWYNLAACLARSRRDEEAQGALEKVSALNYGLVRKALRDEDFCAFLSTAEGAAFLNGARRPAGMLFCGWFSVIWGPIFLCLLPLFIFFYGWVSVSSAQNQAPSFFEMMFLLTAFLIVMFLVVLQVKVLLIDLARRRYYSWILNLLIWAVVGLYVTTRLVTGAVLAVGSDAKNGPGFVGVLPIGLASVLCVCLFSFGLYRLIKARTWFSAGRRIRSQLRTRRV